MRLGGGHLFSSLLTQNLKKRDNFGGKVNTLQLYSKLVHYSFLKLT